MAISRYFLECGMYSNVNWKKNVLFFIACLINFRFINEFQLYVFVFFPCFRTVVLGMQT